MQTLAEVIFQLKIVRQAHETPFSVGVLISEIPRARTILDEWAMPEQKIVRWFCDPRFDGGAKSAAELFREGRGNEVVTGVRQIVHGVY